MKKIALTIAGSDNISGAGIQADLKTFTALGVHGTTAITCITAQNTQNVKKIYKLPVEIVDAQIDAVFEDMKPDSVKTGMLFDEGIIHCVSKKIKQYRMKTVVDPVMVATSGDPLSSSGFIISFKKEILPKSYVLTPNTEEASILADVKIKTLDDVKKCCKKIYDMGPEYVLIKGGHLDGKTSHDVFYDGKNYKIFSLPRISNKKAHGSGCTLSALITGFLARGEKPVVAVEKSKNVLWNMIKEGYKLGKGSDVLDHRYQTFSNIPFFFKSELHFSVWHELKQSVDDLLKILPISLVPEVGINFGYALPDAEKFEDICAINGRIIKTKDKPVVCGGLDFGVSKHVASIIFSSMMFDKSYRSAMNIKYSKNNLECCKQVGFTIGSFDRKNEPKGAKSTMEWGTKEVIEKMGIVPDIIYDTGGIGKEPMIRVIGKKPASIVNKISKIVDFL